jgi:hypothetical protein
MVLTVLVAAGCSDDAAVPASTSTTSPSEQAGILEGRGQMVTWTDEGLFVYGGQSNDRTAPYRSGAALVDPSTAAVTALPEPPFEAPLETGSEAATSGRHVLLIGRPFARRVTIDADTDECRPGGLAAAQFSLDDGSWETVELPGTLVEQLSPDPEQGVRVLGVTSDDRVVVEPTYGQALTPGESRTWTYRAADGEWAQLPPADTTVEQSCLAGDRLVVSSSRLVDESTVELTVGVLDLDTGGWTASSPLTAVLWGPALVCAQDVALVHSNSYDLGTFRLSLDPMGSWEELPDLPDDAKFAHPVVAGDQVLLANRERPEAGLVLDPTAFTWERVDMSPWYWPTLPVWTGEAFVVLDHVDDGISLVPLP